MSRCICGIAVEGVELNCVWAGPGEISPETRAVPASVFRAGCIGPEAWERCVAVWLDLFRAAVELSGCACMVFSGL
jgi:hypothetical protein